MTPTLVMGMIRDRPACGVWLKPEERELPVSRFASPKPYAALSPSDPLSAKEFCATVSR